MDLAAYDYRLSTLRWYTYQASTIVEALRTGGWGLFSWHIRPVQIIQLLLSPHIPSLYSLGEDGSLHRLSGNASG